MQRLLENATRKAKEDSEKRVNPKEIRKVTLVSEHNFFMAVLLYYNLHMKRKITSHKSLVGCANEWPQRTLREFKG